RPWARWAVPVTPVAPGCAPTTRAA
ncbi:hypothetical protein XPN_3468, partial [Xanthomonas arboricola pv. pruni MAFF 301427]